MTALLVTVRPEAWHAGLSDAQRTLWAGIWHAFTRHYTSRGATARGLAWAIAGVAKPRDERTGMRLRGELCQLIIRCKPHLPEGVERRALDAHWADAYDTALAVVRPHLEGSQEGDELLAQLALALDAYKVATDSLEKSVEATLPHVQVLLDLAVAAQRVLIAGSSSMSAEPHYILVRDS